MTSVRSTLLVMVAAVALSACVDDSTTSVETTNTTNTTNTTTTPASTATTPATSSGSGQQPEGFTTILAQITDADGEVCEVCLWLADDATERGQGLMGVNDLGDAVGMAFRFDEATSGPFFMLNTPTPLSIAWFLPGGDFAVATDMEPCVEVPEDGCPLYAPGVEYELALEVFAGGLGPLGIGPGSRMELIEGSEADRCPATS